MKFKKLVISLAIMIAITPAISSAASDDECGIWLCAPIGFAPGDCAGPHRAMIRRIHKLQSPLPSLSSCEAMLTLTQWLHMTAELLIYLLMKFVWNTLKKRFTQLMVPKSIKHALDMENQVTAG